MATDIYTFLSGEEISLELEQDAAAFLARARLATIDPKTSANDLIELIYGEDNPILTKGVIPGRGLATRESLEHPLYPVLQDLIQHKQIASGYLLAEDLVSRRAEYTLTVQEASDRLGITDSAIRHAIRSGRLASEKRGGQHWLRETEVDEYTVSTRGRKRNEATSS